MPKRRNLHCTTIVAAAVALAAFAPSNAGAHAKMKVLYSFTGGADGNEPTVELLRGKNGMLYGTTFFGGGGACACGVVFQVAPDGTESVLYEFAGGNDGNSPRSGLIMDKAGNLYGTTEFGGPSNNGTVYKIAPDGTETVLHAFASQDDGAIPLSTLVMDDAGNPYGTTQIGGAGQGTVFKIAADGTESVLHSFTGGSDGGTPLAGLVRNKNKLYSTTELGGDNTYGTLFEITTTGTFKVLHSFAGGNDGEYPAAAPVRDRAGNLYGTTFFGGAGCDCGTVYKFAPDGTESVVYAFAGGNDGQYPEADSILDPNGNLYSTTAAGGGACKCGTVFRLAPDGTEKLLHSFTGGSDEGLPSAGVILDKRGNLYGTTTGASGAYGYGTVFKIKN